ncbi:MAG: ABC transporter permease [Brachymonas sp.]|nr:ABC transporter permease [Brachymonas sp.]
MFSDRQFNFLLLVNAAVFLFASLWSQGQFVQVDNLQSMASQLPELGFLAIGVMLAMVAGDGGIDLSGVALANLAGIVAAMLVPEWFSSDDAPLAFTAAFIGVSCLVGLLGGLFNGVLIAYFSLTPILATLGTQLLFTGIAVVLSDGSAVRLGYVEELSAIGNETVLGVPIAFALFLFTIAALALVLKRTRFGVQLYLQGSNAKAARYAGFAQRRLLLATYTVCGLMAAIAGIIIASRTASAKWDYGSSYLLIAILIVVMAGVKPAGGYGRVVCLLLSAVALQALSSAFNLIEISNFFRDCAWGALLLIFLAASDTSWQSWFRRATPAS